MAILRRQALQRYGAVILALLLFTLLGLALWAPPAATSALGRILGKGQSSRPSSAYHAGGALSDAAERVVEMEGLKMGAPMQAKQAREQGKTADEVMSMLRTEVHDRFVATLHNKPLYPQCNLSFQRYEALRHGSRSEVSQTVSIAINLHNSEAIVPAQSTAIMEALAFLQPYHKVYVSLFENGSEDLTRETLADFAAALDALGVDGIWVQTSRLQTSGSHDRMAMLSEIRNHALRPLIPYARSGTLISMNDVATCPEDILELIYQRHLQSADAVIGTDWITLDDGRTTLYDLWATRGINGELPFLMRGDSGLQPVRVGSDWMRDYWITQQKFVHQRWLDGLPLPIYSGWGGMAAFDAALFTRDRLRFRSSATAGWEGGTESGSMGAWGKLIGTPGYLDGDCPGDSECKLIHRDIWNLRGGKAKIVLAPRARTVYKVENWAAMGQLEQLWAEGKLYQQQDTAPEEIINWENVRAPGTVVCMASRTKDGASIDVWGVDNSRYHLNPVLDMAVRQSKQ
jgi:alpha-1,3-mannosyltransferase